MLLRSGSLGFRPPVQLWVVAPYTTFYLSQPFPVLVVTVHTIPCGQLTCISEMANRRAKRTKIWASGVSI